MTVRSLTSLRPLPLLLTCFLLLPLAASTQSAQAPAAGNAVQVEMHNVFYHFTPGISVHITQLRGELAPRDPSGFPVFDDKNSFTLSIHSASIAIPLASLANDLNQRVFAAHDAPLKNISLSVSAGRLKVKGKLHSKGDLPFESEGAISATPDGKIRLHAEKVKALHLSVEGLMDLFGIELADLIKTNKLVGVRAEKDDIILDPAAILPPPQIAGKVSEVRLEGDNVVQVFGGPIAWRPSMTGNYMAYRGNRLRFGKLTMQDTDMVLLDMDPADPFDFSLDRYQEQLTAGYTKITPQFGLRVYMRDLNKLPAAATKPSAKK